MTGEPILSDDDENALLAVKQALERIASGQTVTASDRMFDNSIRPRAMTIRDAKAVAEPLIPLMAKLIKRLATPMASRAEPQSGHYLWEHPTLPPRVARVEDADFAHGEPKWVRCYPVEVFAGVASRAVVAEPEVAVASVRIKTWHTGKEYGLEGLEAIMNLPDGGHLLYTGATPIAPAATAEPSEHAENILKSWLDDQHPDDIAVDAFASKMRQKMTAARAKGRGGWNDKAQCSAETLSHMLREHVEKGDPVDVANFAMMLAQRGERILPDRAGVASLVAGEWHPQHEEIHAHFKLHHGGPNPYYACVHCGDVEPGLEEYLVKHMRKCGYGPRASAGEAQS